MNNEHTKESQRVRLTRRLLKESLFELLKNKSISKISVSELCVKAGINRTTFYAHYGSQYDVLQDIGKEYHRKYTQRNRAYDLQKYAVTGTTDYRNHPLS